MMGVISKIHQSNVELCTDSRSFLAITYTLSSMPESVIRGNVMDDCKVQFGEIYNDEGSDGFKTIENNIVTKTVHTPYFYHLVTDFDARQKNAEATMKNNYFHMDFKQDERYRSIWTKAGVLT